MDGQGPSAVSNVNPLPEEHTVPRKSKLRFWAALASSFVPGSGQLMLGMRRSGLWLLSGFLLAVLAICLLRMPATYWGYVLTVWCMLLLGIYAACDALCSESRIASVRPSRWWLLVSVPLTFLLVMVTYLALFRAAGFRTFTIPSTSMEPTLVPGDRFVVDTLAYRSHDPKHRDIVAFRKDNIYYVKRVIAVGGDTIQGRYGAMYLNGQELSEPYVVHRQPSSVPFELTTFAPVTVPIGRYFVMGDNRDVSYDSRSRDYGPVRSEMIVGKTLYIYLPGSTHRDLR